MNTSKVLIFGGTGFLGSRLLQSFPSTTIAPPRSNLDLLNIEAVYKFIEKSNPSIIVYAAGITQIDVAEKNKNIANKLNWHIPQKISQFVAKSSIPFIYISTNAVFDGYKDKFIFSEKTPQKARSIYGLSKLHGEHAVLNANQKNSVVRLITLYGQRHTKPNFVMNMIDRLKNKKEFLGIVDQIQNPLHVDIAAEGILFIIKQQLNGIYNLGALDSNSNYNFLINIAQKLRLDSSLIKKTTFNNFIKNKQAYQKKKTILLCEKFHQVSHQQILEPLDKSALRLSTIMK